VISADDVMVDMNQLGVIVSGGLDAISGRLAQELAGMTDAVEIQDKLLIETNAVRESIADAIETYSGTISHG